MNLKTLQQFNRNKRSKLLMMFQMMTIIVTHHHKLSIVLNMLTPRKRQKWNGKQIKTNKSIKEELKMCTKKPCPSGAAKYMKNPSS